MKGQRVSAAFQNNTYTKGRRSSREGKSTRLPLSQGAVAIHPVEASDPADELKMRHLAAARFNLNNRLVAELFSPSIVPDDRTINTQKRLDHLKGQLTFMESHKKKMEEDLIRMQEMHAKRVEQIKMRREAFEKEYKEICDKQAQVAAELQELPLCDWCEETIAGDEEHKKKEAEKKAQRAAVREQLLQQNPVLSKILLQSSDEQ